MLTVKEIRLILKAIHPAGVGYSDDPEIGALQAKLSIMLHVAYDAETRRATVK